MYCIIGFYIQVHINRWYTVLWSLLILIILLSNKYIIPPFRHNLILAKYAAPDTSLTPRVATSVKPPPSDLDTSPHTHYIQSPLLLSPTNPLYTTLPLCHTQLTPCKPTQLLPQTLTYLSLSPIPIISDPIYMNESLLIFWMNPSLINLPTLLPRYLNTYVYTNPDITIYPSPSSLKP